MELRGDFDVPGMAPEELIERYRGLLNRWAARPIPGYDWDDLWQEAARKMLYAQGRYDPRRGVPFYAYASNAIHNIFKGFAKKGQRAAPMLAQWSYTHVENLQLVDPEPGPAEVAAARALYERLQTALSPPGLAYLAWRLGLTPVRPADAGSGRREVVAVLADEYREWYETLREPVEGFTANGIKVITGWRRPALF